MAFRVPERYRVVRGQLATAPYSGNNGLFILPKLHLFRMRAIASDGDGWEHVSVVVLGANRTPNWPEMCSVKNLFWDPEDAVIQIHPARSQHVSYHDLCLHPWRPVDASRLALPPSWHVGPLEGETVMDVVAQAMTTMGG